jgi:predicted metal-dependent enzyme (double-stranded beta helix superfamily)
MFAEYRRVDERTRPDYADLVAAGSATEGPGEVSLVYPPDDDIHLVRNGSGGVAVSLHVYGADIGAQERHAYDPLTGQVTRFVSGYTLLGP